MPELPPIDGGAYLVDILMKRGPVMSGGMGPAAMSDLDLRAYQDNSGISLSPWEVDLILGLSKEYLNESQLATEIDRPSPWDKLSQQTPNIKAETLRSSLRELAKL